MAGFGMGQAVRRTEDARLLTGRGRYTDDLALPGQAYSYVLRSPHAHAVIRGIDASAAREAPRVIAIFTADDLAADGVGALDCVPMTNRDGTPAKTPRQPILERDRVRHVGDRVAFVVAETLEAARDAAELIEVDYETLLSVTDTVGALAPGQSLVWDEVPGNLAIDWSMGDEAKTRDGFARAARVVDIEIINNRIVVNSMEPRNAVASYDPAEDHYTLHTGSQGAHNIQRYVAKTLHLDEGKLRVVTGDVGGGFGMKMFPYPEQILVTWAARKIGRPVRWNSERSEAFLSDTQGRDHVTKASLALDDHGIFLAARFATVANLGAYLSTYALFVPTQAGSPMLAGVYRTPAVHVSVKGVFTNTVPVDAYRGAGRPEAAYVVERLVDKAARRLGIEPDELRRRNFIGPDEMPFRTALNCVYDSGDFAKNLDDALRIIDKPGLAARKAAAQARGKLRGLGLSTYIEQCGGGGPEMAHLRFDPEGGVTLMIGSQASGQGHETAYAQIIAGKLGLPLDQIRVIQGDTAIVLSGDGTGGSRSLPIGGASTDLAIEQVIERGRKIAAHLLEAAEADIEFADGTFTIVGTDRSVPLAGVVKAAFDSNLPEGMPSGSFEETARWSPENGVGTFPNGTHAVEVEIDPDTGEIEILRFVVVDDFGTVVNPMLLAGQVHGGVVQGIGQALHEETVYDPESGQLLTGSFMDYRLPRAADIPMIEFSYNVIPCTTNRLGVKGAGEAGAIGAPAIINAIVDALSPYGIEHIDMPATPKRIWEAIEAARPRQAAE